MQQSSIINNFDLTQKNLEETYSDFLTRKNTETKEQDMIVFSHLRWDFVFQRPQHLMTRFAKDRRVYFFEEPHFTDQNYISYKVERRENGVKVIVPILPKNIRNEDVSKKLAQLVDNLIKDERIEEHVSWYYTPMALTFTRHLIPSAIIFDCMDELSAFKDAPKELISLEAELLKAANVVFTGGQSLYEAKKKRHHNIYPFPSSIDAEHFKKARILDHVDPKDQETIPHPRLGFFGVIDERMDIELIAKIAEMKPDWHIVMIGPVAKINPDRLPKRPNIHYLGKKNYQELPQYLAGWDVALLPFAMNESTRFISPTKTPEYLAAGKPVVSTPVRDVIRPYADEKLVSIAENAEDFVHCAEKSLRLDQNTWLAKVDLFLADMSWDATFNKMAEIVRRSYNSQFKPSSFTSDSNSASASPIQLGT